MPDLRAGQTASSNAVNSCQLRTNPPSLSSGMHHDQGKWQFHESECTAKGSFKSEFKDTYILVQIYSKPTYNFFSQHIFHAVFYDFSYYGLHSYKILNPCL